jgi:hypothetical protein
MKFILTILLLIVFAGLSFGQAKVTTIPSFHQGYWLLGSATDYVVITGSTSGQATTAFSAEKWRGAATLWFIADTSDADSAKKNANVSDSCLAIGLQLKSKLLGGWGGLYSETTTNYTILDTIDRAYVNNSSDMYHYLPLAEEPSWANADSARFLLFIGTTDTLPGKLLIQGQ